jgi:tetratricopeptide (TPR) repeat protein
VQSPERFELQAAAFDKAITANNFDLARGAVEGYLSWLERLPNNDPARRERIVAAVSGALAKFPADVRVRLMERTAEILAKQGDVAAARDWLSRAAAVLAATGLQEEDITPAKCDLAVSRARIGDRDEALADLDAAKRDYLERRFRIQSPFRAQSPRALAEGYAAVGDLDSAINCYQTALSDGIVNPNSCPRAEDLAATCASIARSGVPVPDDVQDRIKRIRVDFRDPW